MKEGGAPFFETGHFCTPEEVVRLIKLPENPQQIPQILAYICPARSGSTAFGLLMAGHPRVDRSYFQPWKNGLRHNRPTIIFPGDKLIVMKETIGPIHEEEIFDPIAILLQAGVPPEKITVIFGLRNPVETLASLENFVPGGMNIEYFARMQRYIIDLFDNYRNWFGERIIPFSYDLLVHGEKQILIKLLTKTGLGLERGLRLRFDRKALGLDRCRRLDPNPRASKMVWGEAADPTYFEEAVFPTVRQGKFSYVGGTKGSVHLPPEKIIRVTQLCQYDFEKFQALARKELGL